MKPSSSTIASRFGRPALAVMLALGSTALSGSVLSGSVFAQCPGGYGPRTSGGEAGPSGPSGPSGPAAPTPAGPATPSAPAPAVPTSGPDGPFTGGPPGAGLRGPTTGGPAGPRAGGRRGMPMVFTHGRTSAELLLLDWDHPVYTPPAEEGNQTRAVVRKALDVAEALKIIAGDDRRPLLAMRECLLCEGSDVALLSQSLRNERTILLTRWFHCVKLPTQVSQENHPFGNLFADKEHLFLCAADGSNRVDFDGMQTQTQLWKAMTGLLRDTYQGNPETAVKEMLRLLLDFDKVDEQESLLMRDLDKELETNGARSAKVRRLQQELETLGKRRAALVQRQKELADLGLKAPEGTAAGK